jgi:hypothetical protein
VAIAQSQRDCRSGDNVRNGQRSGAHDPRAQRSAGTLGTILTVMLVASAAGMAIARYLT